MSDGDDKLLRRYRELSRDEPPGAIDAAILAASRRAVAGRPWSKRLAAPVSIAAVLMLAVGVTLNMQREEPGIETAISEKSIPAAPAAPAVQAPAATHTFQADTLARESKPAKAPKASADSKRKKELEERPAAVAPPEARPEPRAFAATPPPATAPASPPQAAGASAPLAAPSAAAPATESIANAPVRSLQDQARGPERALAKSAAPRENREAAGANVASGKLHGDDVALADPGAELERIARLRSEGRHEEADKALEEFVRKNPDYRIPERVRDRVRRR
jgi:hypothetical protein